MLDREEALGLARKIVEASRADETEVVIESVDDRFVRFADSGPTQSADRNGYTVSVRARLNSADGLREAKAVCAGVDAAQTQATLEQATRLAQVAPPNAELRSLEGQVEVAERGADRATIEHSFDEKAGWVQLATKACAAEGLLPAGLAQTTGTSVCLVNSAGREVYASQSRASLALTASGPDFVSGAGFADAIHDKVSELDPESVVRRAVKKAADGRETQALDAGEYTVVLEPNAVSSLLLFASYVGFGAQDVDEASSFLCGRIGERALAEGLSIDDDAHNDFYAGLPFDAEGTPKQRVELVKRGVLTGPVTDSHWAHKLGCANTGHAMPMPNTCGPKPGNLVVHSGNSSLQELISGVERGLLVTQFHYTNLIDPKDLLLTGMTRNGTFLIENGELGPAVKNLRFTESLINAFGNITGIGSEREVAGALFDGEVVSPALRIADFRFTSTTDF